MTEVNRGQGEPAAGRAQDWLRVDARLLGQLLAAQNILFLLPDERRIAEYFSQSLRGIPGVSSCEVRLGVEIPPRDERTLVLPIQVGGDKPLGAFVFILNSSSAFEPYLPFIANLASYVALSLENQRQKRLLEASNKELEAFSYSVSHDLRAPLRAITGFSQLLQEQLRSGIDPKAQRYLDSIGRSAERMDQLIDDILAFSRMSRTSMNVGQVDMTALAREVYDELKAGAPERNIRFALHQLPGAAGDFAMLRQVWSNLLGNAVKYTAQRAEAQIEVEGAGQAGEVVYSVKDNGAGFDMQYAGKLFGVFQRLHSPNQFEGTGIGLAIVQRIVARHGGRVWAEGEVDRGATLHFALPASPSAAVSRK